MRSPPNPPLESQWTYDCILRERCRTMAAAASEILPAGRESWS
jgi:hypothetical protein